MLNYINSYVWFTVNLSSESQLLHSELYEYLLVVHPRNYFVFFFLFNKFLFKQSIYILLKFYYFHFRPQTQYLHSIKVVLLPPFSASKQFLHSIKILLLLSFSTLNTSRNLPLIFNPYIRNNVVFQITGNLLFIQFSYSTGHYTTNKLPWSSTEVKRTKGHVNLKFLGRVWQ